MREEYLAWEQNTMTQQELENKTFKLESIALDHHSSHQLSKYLVWTR